METVTLGYLGFGILIILLFAGMPIGITMAVIGVVGTMVVAGWTGGLGGLGTVPYSTFASYDLSVIPLFILMGEFCFCSKMGENLYETAYNWLGHLPGGLAMATIGACAGFAAVCGSSLATAATFGTVCLPEMKRYSYSSALAAGCVAAGGTIGILIPPSVVFILYGLITGESIGKLFIAGFIPGILEATLYIATIFVVCKHNPVLGPPGRLTNLKEKIISFKDTWAVFGLFLLVIGGLFMGIFTATEAGGIGAFGAFLFAIIKRRLTWKNFIASLIETTKTTAMIFFLIFGASLLQHFIAITRLPNAVSEFVVGLPINRYGIMVVILLLYLLLGCIMDVIGMILLTVPIFFPVISALGFSPIWFGVIIVIMAECASITPPVGMNVFILKGLVPEVPIGTIFRGIIPFFYADVLLVALLLAFPLIATWLPGVMK